MTATAMQVIELVGATRELLTGLERVDPSDNAAMAEIAGTLESMAHAGRMLLPQVEPASVEGWKILPCGDYAEPELGNGYAEVQDNGDFEVAYEPDQSARDMGLPTFLLTKIPIAVIRELVARFDARVTL